MVLGGVRCFFGKCSVEAPSEVVGRGNALADPHSGDAISALRS
jgi:hypothetical protein